MRYNRPRGKYGARKTIVDGVVFDSKKEAKRYVELKALEEAGVISDLRRQVKYVLIPPQREFSNEIYKSGPKKGCFKPGRLIERECAYIADFQYTENGKLVVEDTKGVRTKEYIIKRKLMLHEYCIRIREV